jgi:fucose permease
MIDYLQYFMMNVYAYCTDFIINLANILHLSYYEVNFILFCVIYPILIIGLPIFYLVQKIRLRRIGTASNIETK